MEPLREKSAGTVGPLKPRAQRLVARAGWQAQAACGAGGGAYRDALGLQDEAGHVARRQAPADGVPEAVHQLRPEGVARGHLEEEDDPLLAILVVLGHAQAVHHLLEGFHCGDSALAQGGSESVGRTSTGGVGWAEAMQQDCPHWLSRGRDLPPEL